MTLEIAAVCIGAYLVGALPFGLWIAATRGVDIRTVGSGNIGATNVWRAVGPLAGLLVLLLDTLKGYLPAIAGGLLLARGSHFAPEYALLAGASAVVGHSASVFLGFRGGKGVATALGVLIAATPRVAGPCLGVWLVLLLATRYVSLSSIVAVLLAPLLAYLYGYPILIVYVYSALAALIVVRHTANVSRLVRGEELRFGLKTKTQSRTATGADETQRPAEGNKP